MSCANAHAGGRRPVSLLTVLLCSSIGSALVILVVLAASPLPNREAEDRIDRALELYGKGDRPGAQAVADEIVRLDPDEPRGWLLQGMLAEDRKAVGDAERAYLRSLEVLAQDDLRRADVEVTLADLLRRKGDPEGALKAIDKVARARGESGRIHHARVLSLMDLRRFDDALSEARLLAEEKFGGGVAKKLEKQIRSLMDAGKPRNG